MSSHLGGNRPAVNYWATSLASPRGVMFGLQGQAFQPESMQVQQVGSEYALCNGSQVVCTSENVA